jgi:alpha,alpha-trehalase
VEDSVPPDWVESPAFLLDIHDNDARVWGEDLHWRWKALSKRFNHKNLCKDCYSSLWLPRPFIIPGGRFREPYYWDTYWILRGLLVSGMNTTAKYLLENLAYMVETLGFIPNGARIYYLNRSQPPILVWILDFGFNFFFIISVFLDPKTLPPFLLFFSERQSL